MKQDEKKNDMDIIKKLIAEEEEVALGRFRDGDFSARVKSLIHAEKKGRSFSSLRRRIPLAAWGGAALLVVVGIITFLFFIPRIPQTSTIQTIETFLRQTPAIQGLIKSQNFSAREGGTVTSRFEEFIIKALGSSDQKQLAEKTGQDELVPDSRSQQMPHLDLEKMYRILIQEKYIERVLSLSLKKFEEV